METKLQLGSESSPFGRPIPPSEEGNRNTKDRNKLNPLYKLTVGIIPLYKSCNSNFKPQTSRPQRLLTNPSEGVSNNGLDNVDANLICRVGDKLMNSSGKVLVVLDALGTGTFGQVFRCQREDTKEIVAVKIIKNKPAYHSQGLLEIKIASLLNNTYDPNNERHIVRLLDNFEHKQHICLVFELLSMSLLDVLTQNQFRGLPLSVVQRFAKQILMALVALQDANVIHCDLKPENILIQPASSSSSGSSNSSSTNSSNSNINSGSNTKPRSDSVASSYNDDSPLEGSTPGGTVIKKSSLSDVKVIDFGSACFEGKTVYSYIQSRFYRSPEVLLGIPYNGAIDMWSLACVCAEMYLGLPLFPGVSQHNQLTRIVEMLGVPPDFLVEGKNGSKYFTTTGSGGSGANSPSRFSGGGGGGFLHQSQRSTHKDDKNILSHVSGRYRMKTSEEYAIENNAEIPVLKKYLRYTHLDEVIMKCPLSNKSKMSQEQKHHEMMKRRSFLDFLQGLFNLNPFDRWTAQQAMSHPFILNMPFNGTPFEPSVDLKAKERKLMYIYQTKQDAIRPEDAGSLGGLRAPTNFGSSHDQFTLLQYGHRRQSEPIDPNKTSNYYQIGEKSVQQQQQQSMVKQQQKTGIAAAVEEEEPTMSDLRPNLKRGNPVHINASYVEESPMERMMHQQSQQAGQKVSPKSSGARNGPPLPPAPAVAAPYYLSQSYAPPSQYAQQQQQQQQLQLQHSHFAHQQQAYFHINNNQPFSAGGGGGAGSVGAVPPFPLLQSGGYPQYGYNQPPHAMSPAGAGVSAMTAASYSASSMGVFGHGGSMQEGPNGMVMTDFGLALLRPDMDEQRRLMSQNAGYTSHAAQLYVGGQMQQHQHQHLLQQQQLQPQRYGNHEKASPRSQQQQQQQQQQYSTAHSLDYSMGNVSRYAMTNANAGSAYGQQQQQQQQYPSLLIDGSQVGGQRTGPELPSPVQQYTRGNTRRLQQHANNTTYVPSSSSLSISIPTPLNNSDPVPPEPVLAYSFQNTDTSSSLIGSINYTNQWENTHIGAAASLSRSLGVNTIQQQQQNSRKNSDAVQKNSLDDYDELTDDSSPKVSYKSISTRTSESSIERDRSGSGGVGGGIAFPTGVGPMDDTTNTSGKESGLLNRSNSGGSSGSAGSSGSGGGNNTRVAAGVASTAVKGASDALENWDPFFDAED